MTICLLSLGIWQTQRLQWKQGLLAKFENTNPSTFIALEQFLRENNDLKAIQFNKVKLRGTFHHDLAFHIIPRTWNGRSGAHLYTPMTLSSSGKTLLVNRGWVPDNSKDITVQEPSDEVNLLGYLQVPTAPSWVTPDNVADKEQWYYLDLDVLSKRWPELGQALLPYYVIASPDIDETLYPKPLNPLVMIRNNHLGYAITWFSLAFVLLVMYIVYVRKQRL